jgi:hypothetical protein
MGYLSFFSEPPVTGFPSPVAGVSHEVVRARGASGLVWFEIIER